MDRVRRLILTHILLLLFLSLKAVHASPYIEGGTAIGNVSQADAMAQTSLGTLGTSFIGSLSLYVPVTPIRKPIHFELGLQNRFTTLPGENGNEFMLTPQLAARLEFWRFFVGGGYAPKVLINFKPYQGSTAYFGEAGVIWRVVPEFQICAAFALEYGLPLSGGKSPSPSTEYGLRFRFPLNPKEGGGASAVDYDGHRYPFGIMR